jgi:hypothetical protein
LSEGIKSKLQVLEQAAAFVKALNYLTHPQFRWKDWMDQVKVRALSTAPC